MVSKQQASRQRQARERAAEAERRSGGRQRRRRRIIIAVVAAIASLAMVLPLAAGIFAIATGGGSTDSADVATTTVPTTTVTAPAFVTAGRTITGEVPCPAADGTELRTTTFSGPPPMCIDTSATYSVDLVTSQGDVVLSIDPTLDPVAANLFVVLAEYGYFTGLPVYTSAIDGPAISGDAGSIQPGFAIPATPVDLGATGSDASPQPTYRIGSVIMAADQDQLINTRFAVVTTQEVADALSAAPVHPVIGQVSSGLDVLMAIVGDQAAVLGSSADIATWLSNAIRIDSVSVSIDTP